MPTSKYHIPKISQKPNIKRAKGVGYILPLSSKQGNLVTDLDFVWTEPQLQAWQNDKIPPKLLHEVDVIMRPMRHLFLGRINFTVLGDGRYVMSGSQARMIKMALEADVYIWSGPRDNMIVVPKGKLDFTKFFPDCAK